MRKDAPHTSKPKPLFFLLGFIGIALMVYTASTGDLGAMLIGLLFATGVGAYVLSTGIETHDRTKIIMGGLAWGATILAAGLVLMLGAVLLVAPVVNLSDTAITTLGAVLQGIVSWVCIVMGW